MMKRTAILLLFAAVTLRSETEKLTPLFNGKDLTGWVPVNIAPGTFSVKDGMLVTTGSPIGVLRTEKMVENFELELEWRHMTRGGNSGVFVWGDGFPAAGTSYPRGIEVQVLDNGYDAKGKNLLDHQAGPDHVEQLGLGDQALAPFDERQQHIESARAERDGLAVGEQTALDGQQLEAAEAMALNHAFPLSRKQRRTTAPRKSTPAGEFVVGF